MIQSIRSGCAEYLHGAFRAAADNLQENVAALPKVRRQLSSNNQTAKVIGIAAVVFLVLGLMVWLACRRWNHAEIEEVSPPDSPQDSPRERVKNIGKKEFQNDVRKSDDLPPSPDTEKHSPDIKKVKVNPQVKKPISIELPVEAKLFSPHQLLQKACHTLMELDLLMGPLCSNRWTPRPDLLKDIDQLKPLEDDAQHYLSIADELNEAAENYSRALLLNIINLQDPRMKLLMRLQGKEIGFIYALLADYYFQKNDLASCVGLAKKIMLNSDLQTAVLLPIASAYIKQEMLDNAMGILKQTPYSHEREKLLLAIARIQLDQAKYDDALITAKTASNSGKREALIFKIAEHYLKKNELERALEIAQGLSYSEKREEFVLKVAEVYFQQNQLDMALKTAKSLYYSVKREQFISRIAKAYFLPKKIFSDQKDGLLLNMDNGEPV